MSGLLIWLAVAMGAGNVALGKAYVLEPAPAYEHCTEAGDAVQLTDGVYTEGHFWTQASTVGWGGVKPIVIEIDLGKVEAISGVSVNTAAGVAGVRWPETIDVLVADEPGQYRALGDLVKMGGTAPAEGYATHRYVCDTLRAHGRYVALVVAAEPFFFCDEIEVYAGDPAWLGEALPGPVLGKPRDVFVQSMVEYRIREQLLKDVTAIRERVASASIDAERKTALTVSLDALDKETAAADLRPAEGFRAVLPLNALHERILAVQAERWRLAGLQPLTVWQSGLWDALSHLADPNKGRAAAVEIFAMRKEYRAGAFNLSNASERAMTLTLRFEGLPGGAMPEYLRIHEVAWTGTFNGDPVAAALPDAERRDDGYVIRIPAGMTRQVWLTFHPVSLEAGTYAGKVLIDGDASAEVPVSLQVYPLEFPERPSLHFGGWDYTDNPKHYDMGPDNREALVAFLREYWVDSPWGSPAVLTYGQYDAGGAMTSPPDTAHFDAWVARWPGARQYLVFPAVGDAIAGFKMGTPEFDRAVQAWGTFWAEHARSKGIEPEQFGLLLVDEPSTPEPQAIIKAWAKALRDAKTGLRVWEDPIFHESSGADAEMLALCDSLCPNRPLFLAGTDEYRKLFTDPIARGTALEFYSCSGPVRNLDPYSYHRLQAWDCFRYGATASYFWAFGDAGGQPSWNEYALERPGYAPEFIDETSVVTGKHMEACREGIEDYEYLLMLRKKGGAEALLEDVVKRVCDGGRLASFQWRDALDRGTADAARREVLEALVK
ncbi:MAG: hypothetical protein RBU21_10720 [FCB group bacterium]|jgi:hypothetical protein|nr:hypothetical protein [FCB group bacterium]